MNADFHAVVFSDYGAPAKEAVHFIKSIGVQMIRKLDQKGISKKIQASLFQILSVDIQKQNARTILSGKVDRDHNILGLVKDILNFRNR